MAESKKIIVRPKSLTRKIFMYFNILLCFIIIGLAINSYVQLFQKDSNIKLEWDNLQLIFMPFYLILFSLTLFLAEIKVQFILKSMPFLNTYFGIGMFNIFIASNMGQPGVQSGDDPLDGNKMTTAQYFNSVIAYILFVLGSLYCGIFWCISDVYDAEEMKKRKLQEQEKKLKKQQQQKDQMQRNNKDSLEENLIGQDEKADEENQIEVSHIQKKDEEQSQELDEKEKEQEKDNLIASQQQDEKQQLDENKEAKQSQIQISDVQVNKQENYDKMFGTSENQQNQQQTSEQETVNPQDPI